MTRSTPIAFVFGGQGPEWWGMGRELYEREPVFAARLRECDNALRRVSGSSIIEQFSVPEAKSLISRVDVAQAMLLAVHLGLASLWEEWGVVPAAVVGHSAGELSAFCFAGALTVDEAMRVIVARAAVMRRLAGAGLMVSAKMDAASAADLIRGLEDRVAVGVVNAPNSIVLSGDGDAMPGIVHELSARGIEHRMLRMPYAVHAPRMAAAAPELARTLSDLAPKPSRIPIISTVTGEAMDGADADAAHWARNIAEPVRFTDAVATLLARGVRTFLEIGPHPILGMPITECATATDHTVTVLPSLHRQQPELSTMRATLTALTEVNAKTEEPSLRLALESMPEAAEARLITHIQGLVAQWTAWTDATAPDPDRALRDLGLDSAGAVAIASTLGRDLGRRLPATLLFERPTIRAVASALLDDGGPRLSVAHRRARRTNSDDAIAIVGIGCRFPGGADSPDALWRLLLDEVDAVSEVPSSRWDATRLFDADPSAPGKSYGKWGGFVDDVDRFDAGFFGVSPREARSMDPQQRLLLEVSWEALERANVRPSSLAGTATGVFIGVSTSDYGGRLLYGGDPEDIDAYTFTGNSPSVAAGRLAYSLGLNGPALVVDTACSSSLVAVHLACNSLRSGECDVALAGGVNVMLSPELMVYFSRLRALSPTGRARAFDAAADGYVRGEGCGVVVLKRLSDAAADGDRIIAVVRGTAMNQDGRSNGLTAPNGAAQEAVVRAALEDAGVPPAAIGYVEAHGTGTPLGDPIEVRALAAALGEDRAAPLVVGSIKSNIGHTEGAAGVAALIKAALCVERGVIPRSLHVTTPNPHVAWSEVPVEIARARREWNAVDVPRMAGVSAFGFSGTNAHIVVSQAPASIETASTGSSHALPLVLSARSDAALRAAAGRLAEHLRADANAALVDVVHTLTTSRDLFDSRAVLVVRDRSDAIAQLDEVAAGRATRGAFVGTRDDEPLALLFAGEGAQRPAMGSALRSTFPEFDPALDDVCQRFDAQRGAGEPSLATVIAAPRGTPEAARLDEPLYAQPALFAVEVALFRLVAHFGLRPTFLLGYGVGEVAAAHVAGVMSLHDAMRLVIARARQFQERPQGIAFSAPRVPVVSNVSGRVAHGDELITLDYWTEQLHNTVRFAEGAHALSDAGVAAMLELSPDPVLGELVSRALGDTSDITCAASMRASDETTALLEGLAALHVRGHTVDWARVVEHTTGRRVPLPTYPFQRERYWIDVARA